MRLPRALWMSSAYRYLQKVELNVADRPRKMLRFLFGPGAHAVQIAPRKKPAMQPAPAEADRGGSCRVRSSCCRPLLACRARVARLFDEPIGGALGLRGLAKRDCRLVLEIRILISCPLIWAPYLCAHSVISSGNASPQRWVQVRAPPISSAILAPRAPIGFLRPSVVSFAVWCSNSALISPPISTMMVDSHSHTMKPITAPREP
jgi:hypothetical protein